MVVDRSGDWSDVFAYAAHLRERARRLRPGSRDAALLFGVAAELSAVACNDPTVFRGRVFPWRVDEVSS